MLSSIRVDPLFNQFVSVEGGFPQCTPHKALDGDSFDRGNSGKQDRKTLL